MTNLKTKIVLLIESLRNKKHGLGYLWSEKACFFMSKQALMLQFILSKNSIEQS